MELELTRVDYTLVGIISQNSLQLIPPKKARDQHLICIGDASGVIQLLSVKKDEIVVHFKTVPIGSKINSIQLAGSLGSPNDKIIVAFEDHIVGYNKKGKVYMTFDTNLTEPIKTLCVTGIDLIICGNHVYTHYKDFKESGTYLCGDTIVDCKVLCPNNTSRIITVLACSGRVLRLLEHCRVRKLIELDSIPTVLHVPKNVHGDKILVGFSDGSVSLYRINAMLTEVKQEILIAAKDDLSAVTCLDTFDLYGDGKDELIVGRRDGTVQVFTTTMLENNEFEMNCQQLLYEENFNESISCAAGGSITLGYTEIIVCTYTGKVFGLTTRTSNEILTDVTSRKEIVSEASQRILKLKAEIEGIEQTVAREREKYQLSTQAISSGLSAIPVMTINDAMTLSADDASYVLSLELPIPIENVLVACNTKLRMLDVEGNNAVVSRSECDENEGNSFLCCFRCQVNTNRLDLKFCTRESQHSGQLDIYVTPNLQPKCCQLKTYLIHPLSLHRRAHSYDETRPMNTITLKGNFSIGEIYSWLQKMIGKEVPDFRRNDNMLDGSGDNSSSSSTTTATANNVMIFENVLVGSSLVCSIKRCQAEFKSDNISTIAILKDFITKEATTKHIKLEISMNIDESTFDHFYKLLEPKFIEFNQTIKSHKILEALLELNVQDDDEFELLSEQYKHLLNNKQELEKKLKFVLQRLDQIIDILKDFLADKTKFKGANVKDGGGGLGLDKLSEALSTCDSRESLLETICSLTSET